MQEVRIRVKGRLNANWSNWLGDMTIAHTRHGETVLSGSVSDQAALYGLLLRLSNLGLHLVSVTSARTSVPRGREARQM